MTNPRKYDFAVRFDDLPEKPAACPTAITSAMLEEARRAGFAEGHAAAHNEAAQSVERSLADLLTRLCDTADAIMRQTADQAMAAEDLALTITRRIITRLLPHSAARDGLAEIEGMVRACLAPLAGERRINLTLHPDMAAALTARLPALVADAGLAADALEMRPDPAMAPSDASLCWPDGRATRDFNQLLSEADTLIEEATTRCQRAPEETSHE